MNQRPVSSALKKSQSSNLIRLKSAVSFQAINDKKSSFSRIQSGMTNKRIESATTNAPTTYVRIDSATPSSHYFQSRHFSAVSQQQIITSKQINPGGHSRTIIVTLDNINSPDVIRRSKFDPEVQKQVLKLKLDHVESSNIRNFLKLFTFYQKKIYDSFKKKDNERMLTLMTDILEWTYSTKQTWVLIEILYLFAIILENMQNYDMASFFYNQMRIITNYSKRSLDGYKIKSYNGLANICIQQNKFEDAIKILKKCLQYTWSEGNMEAEINIYNQLAICFYYLGNLSKSDFYMERALSFDFELDKSPLKLLSNDILKLFIEKNYPQQLTSNINIGLLNKLNLPIENDNIHYHVPEIDLDVTSMHSSMNWSNDSHNSRKQLHSSSPQSQEKKGLHILHVNSFEIISHILKEKEFEFEIYTPRFSYRSESKCFEHLNKKKKIQDVFHDPKLSKYMSVKIGVVDMRNKIKGIEDTEKYKLPLDKQIEIRLKQNYNNEEVVNRIQETVKINRNFASQLRDKIAINHKNVEREKQYHIQDDKNRFQNMHKAYQNFMNYALTQKNIQQF